MGIAGVMTLCLAAASRGNGARSRTTGPEALRVRSLDLARARAPKTRGLRAAPLAPKVPPRPRCYDCGPRVTAPYLMIIDGSTYRFPEDSVRMFRVEKQLQPSDIDSLYSVHGALATERYH